MRGNQQIPCNTCLLMIIATVAIGRLATFKTLTQTSLLLQQLSKVLVIMDSKTRFSTQSKDPYAGSVLFGSNASVRP